MRRERGFTLLETLVALSLTGIVLLLAHQVLGGVVDGSSRLAEARAALDREMNARRWLSEAFGSLIVGTSEQEASFAGHPARVEFTSAQLVAEGWLEPRRVHLGLTKGRVVADIDSSRQVVLAREVSALGFDYLLDPGVQARWVRQWLSPVSAPLAVRMRITYATGAADTLLLLIGPRG